MHAQTKTCKWIPTCTYIHFRDTEKGKWNYMVASVIMYGDSAPWMEIHVL